MSKRDFLAIPDFSRAELEALFDLALTMKRGAYTARPLAGKTLAMIFGKTSTRTRVSFEVGTWQLGGHALFLSSREIQLGRGEPIRDTARVLSGYVDGVMIRTYAHTEVEELARFATVPVINGLTDLLHPCQVLADLLTIQEKFGRLEGLKLAYIGDGNNMAHSLLNGGAKMGMHVAVGHPRGFAPDAGVVAGATAIASESGGSILITEDPREAASNADILYTDVWASMGQEDEIEERIADWTATRDRESTFHELQRAGVTAGPVLNAAEAAADPHLASTGAWKRLPATEDYPEVDWLRPAYRFSVSDIDLREPPCLFGQHNDYVYREVLGLSEAEIDALAAAGHIATTYAPEALNG